MAAQDQEGIWPLPKFYFSVAISGVGQFPCQEVTGLGAETQAIEYRTGNSTTFSTIKMPGLVKTGNVTVIKGRLATNTPLWSWFEQIKMNTIKRQTVTITLRDDDANPTMVWQLMNAWPSKVVVNDGESDGNEVAFELIEFAHDGMTIADGG